MAEPTLTPEQLRQMLAENKAISDEQLAQIRNNEELFKIYSRQSEQLRQSEGYLEKIAKEEANRIEALKKTVEYYDRVLDKQTGLTAEVGKEAVYKADLYREDAKLQRLLLEKQDLLRKEEELQKQLAEAGDDKVKSDAIIKQIENNKILLEQKDKDIRLQRVQTQEREAYYEAGEVGFESALKALGIQDERTKLSFTQSMLLGKVSGESFQRRASEFFESGVAMQRTFLAFAEKVFEMSLIMAKQLDVLRAETFRATGGFTELGDRVMAVSETAGLYGVSFDSMAKSFAALNKNSSNFTELAGKQQKAVAINTAQLTQLGISAEVAGKNFSIFTQSLGMTAEQANASSRELVSLAGNLRMSFEEISAGFGEAATTVAAYGQGAVREFSKLAAESKALGLSVQELISIVKGADTFQGAAEQAGKLNAMLGGGLLNSSQLLVASESERIQLIRDAVMQTGRSFSTMSKYEQIAIANAAGIQDLTVAQKLFNQEISGSELDRYLGKTNALGMSQEQMAEQAAAAQETQEKLKILMEQFAAAMSPVVSGLAAIVNLFMALAPFIKTAATLYGILIAVKYAIIVPMRAFQAAMVAEKAGVFGTIGALLAKIPALIATAAQTTATAIANFFFARSADAAALSGGKVFLIILVLVVAFIALYNILHKAGSPMLYAIFGAIAIGLFFMGEALNKNKQGILAFGAGMMMVGVGAFMAFHGLEGFATALSKLDPTQLAALVAVILILAITMAVLFALVISAGSAAVGPMLALGVAFLLIGAGAFLAGLGLSLVVDSIVGLIGAVASNMAVLFILPMFLQIMAISLLAVSIGLAVFAYTLIGVGVAMLAAYIPILAVIGAVTALSLAINSITPEKSIALKTTVDSIKNFVDTGRDITPETISNLDEVVKQIHKLNVEATISKAVNVTAPFKELIDAVKGQTAATAANKETTVVMKLNDREFGKAVVGVMNEYGTNNTSIRKPTPA